MGPIASSLSYVCVGRYVLCSGCTRSTPGAEPKVCGTKQSSTQSTGNELQRPVSSVQQSSSLVGSGSHRQLAVESLLLDDSN